MRHTVIMLPLAATILVFTASVRDGAAQSTPAAIARAELQAARHTAQYAAHAAQYATVRATQHAAQYTAAHAAQYTAAHAAQYATQYAAAQAAQHAMRYTAAYATRTPVPRPSWAPQDPADSLWRAARAALNRNDYRRAAELFRQIDTRHPRSAYAADALYFEALARSRLNTVAELNAARERLAALEARHPDARHLNDARSLAVRVDGQLARLGDAAAAARVGAQARAVSIGSPPLPPAPPTAGVRPPPAPPAPPTPPRGVSVHGGRPPAHCPDDGGVRMSALNALLQMQSAQAVPLLREVMANRDECSAHLRRQAVFLISQKSAADVEDVLLDAVRNDPDMDVRRQAVFWLSQVNSERAATAIREVLRTSTDQKMQEHALFALSQHRSPRAAETLRDYAMRADVPIALRRTAIFWLTQDPAPEQSRFLRELYTRLDDRQAREALLMGLAQRRNEGNEAWLFSIARNEREPMQMRKQALFWAGQQPSVPARELVALYDAIDDREMRQHLMFVFSQRSEPEVVDKMMDIARRDADPEVRKQALFWLGQSRDPRVARFLADLIRGS